MSYEYHIIEGPLGCRCLDKSVFFCLFAFCFCFLGGEVGGRRVTWLEAEEFGFVIKNKAGMLHQNYQSDVVIMSLKCSEYQ